MAAFLDVEGKRATVTSTVKVFLLNRPNILISKQTSIRSAVYHLQEATTLLLDLIKHTARVSACDYR